MFKVVCNNEFVGDKVCKRVKLAISTGSVATTFALAACILSSHGLLKDYPGGESLMISILFCIYICTVALVTFGSPEKAPASTLGNLYFSLWIGFMLSVWLLSKSIQNVKKAYWGEAEAEPEAEALDKKEEKEEEDVNKKDEEAQLPEAPVEVTAVE